MSTNLFTPLTVRDVTFRSRIAVSPMRSAPVSPNEHRFPPATPHPTANSTPHPTPATSTPLNFPTFPNRPLTRPTPSAQWCVGPSAHHAFTNSSGGNENRNREFVFPTFRIGPGSDSPSAATIFSRPSAVCVNARIVTGPTFTLNYTDTPKPRFPW